MSETAVAVQVADLDGEGQASAVVQMFTISHLAISPA
jgi:hypothetical protein